MHLLKKILPLSLLIVTSITYANDDDIKVNVYHDALSQRGIPGITSPFENNFVNIEIQEVVLKDVKKSIDDINDSVKLTKGQFELHDLLKSVGSIVEENVFKFNNVMIEKDHNFNNLYSRINVDRTARLSLKNKDITKSLKSDNTFNSYNFNFSVFQSENKSVQFKINGDISSDNRLEEQLVNNDNGDKKDIMKNNFKQSSGAQLDEYTVITTVSTLNETRLLIIKVTEPKQIKP